jgi:hypothetical protein
VGGLTAPALRRARDLADGWLASQSADAIDATAIAAARATLPPGARCVLRVGGSAGRHDRVLAALDALRDAGVDDVVVDVDWSGDVAAQARALTAAV